MEGRGVSVAAPSSSDVRASPLIGRVLCVAKELGQHILKNPLVVKSIVDKVSGRGFCFCFAASHPPTSSFFLPVRPPSALRRRLCAAVIQCWKLVPAQVT